MTAHWPELFLGWFTQRASKTRPRRRWPFSIALPMIIGHRVLLRRNNLTDTRTMIPNLGPPPEGIQVERNAEGCYNDTAGGGLLWLGLLDIALALILAFLYYRLAIAELMGRP